MRPPGSGSRRAVQGKAAVQPGDRPVGFPIAVSSIAAEALAKIGELYRIEATIRGRPADQRRDVRQRQARPLLAALKAWFEAQLAKLPPKGGLAQAIRYALGNWQR